MKPTTDLSTDRYGAPRHAGQRMTKADFQRWESDDNYVYEYNDGLLGTHHIHKTGRSDFVKAINAEFQ